jgi:hypothetical protein
MPDNIIFAIGVLSGIFATLTTWAYIEKRREDQPWTERKYTRESNDAAYFRDIQLDKLMLVARSASTARATKPPKEGR